MKCLAWFVEAKVKDDTEHFYLWSDVNQSLCFISYRLTWRAWSGTVSVHNRQTERHFKKGDHNENATLLSFPGGIRL